MEERANVLNDEQQAVVDHDEGPLLVLAGPGSGKTRVLVERFVRLVRQRRATADQILVLAYNNDAAAEMHRRITTALGVGDYPVSTFHAFSRRSLEEFGWIIGLPSSMRLLASDVERWHRMERVLNKLRPSFFYAPTRPRREIRQLLEFIGHAKQEAVPAAGIAAWAENRRTGQRDAQDQQAELYAQAAAVYAALEQVYSDDAVLDYEDLILKLAEGLRDSPGLRESLSSRYRYVMVDEFQDTDHAQSVLLERLVGPPSNLVVVADDDQSIYRFRGASLANIVRFQRTFPDAPQRQLGRNYRCSPQVVEASASFVGRCQPRRAKELESANTAGRRIRIVRAPDLLSEAAWIGAECRRLVFDEHVLPVDIAVLARSKYQLEPIARALSNVGLPCDLRGGGDFFGRDEVKDLLALVRAAVDPTDDLALIRLMRLSRYGLTPVSRARLQEELRHSGRHVIDAGDDDLAVLGEDERDRFVSLFIVDVLDFAVSAHTADAQTLVVGMLERTEHVGVLTRASPLERFQAAANLRQFMELVTNLVSRTPGASLQDLLEFLGLAADAGMGEAESSVDPQGIRLSSAHSAKGLEFAHVFIASVADRRFPVPSRDRPLEIPPELVEEELGASNPEDEERRLFYVAMTRTSGSLAVSYADSYYEGARTPNRPSHFIDELRQDAAHLFEDVAADQVILPPVRPRVRSGTRIGGVSLTVSQLLSFSDCPRQYQYGHEIVLPRLPSRAPVLGTLIHRVLEQASIRRIAGRTVSSIEVQELLADAWNAERFDKLAWADLRPEATRMLDAYLAGEAWDDANIVAAEQDFAVELMGHAVRGRFDRVESRNGRLGIIDYKTGQTQTAEALRTDRQFGFYRLAAERIYGTAEIDLEAHYLASGEVVTVTKSDEQLDRDGKWIYAVAKGIGEARLMNEFAVRPSDFTCPTCAFRIVCDEGRSFLRTQAAAVPAR